VKHISIKLVESLGSKRRVLKLDKAHGTVLLGTETKSLVPALLRKDSLEFVFGRVHGEITHVESVAWGGSDQQDSLEGMLAAQSAAPTMQESMMMGIEEKKKVHVETKGYALKDEDEDDGRRRDKSHFGYSS